MGKWKMYFYREYDNEKSAVIPLPKGLN